MLNQAEMAEVIQLVVTARLLETGKWDEEIKRLLAASKVLSEQHGITRTLADAKQVEARAARKLYDAEAREKALMEGVEKERAVLRAKEERFAAAQAEAAKASTEKGKQLSELETDLARRRDALVAGEVAMTARVAAVARKEAAFEEREAELRAGEKALAAKVSRLKAAVS